MQIPFRFVGLECIMNVGNARMFFDNLRMTIGGNTADEFNDMLSKCRDYATKRRLDQNMKNNPDDMDCNGCDTPQEWSHNEWSRGQMNLASCK